MTNRLKRLLSYLNASVSTKDICFVHTHVQFLWGQHLTLLFMQSGTVKQQHSIPHLELASFVFCVGTTFVIPQLPHFNNKLMLPSGKFWFLWSETFIYIFIYISHIVWMDSDDLVSMLPSTSQLGNWENNNCLIYCWGILSWTMHFASWMLFDGDGPNCTRNRENVLSVIPDTFDFFFFPKSSRCKKYTFNILSLL